MNDPVALGRRVKARRRELGLTQEELAHATALASGTIARLERGEYPARRSTLRAVAQALGMAPGELERAEQEGARGPP